MAACGSDTLRTETGIVVSVDQAGLAEVAGFTSGHPMGSS
jgi:hypothetical protein